MPLFDLFWTFLMVFIWIAWLLILFRVFGDVFRSDSSGWAKAGWTILILFLPILGVLIYLIAHGGDMARRDVEQARAIDEAQRAYIREAAGSSSTADEIAKLADLKERGALTEEEFQTQKAALIS